MPVLALQDGFRGLATEPHASRLGAGQASDLLNVDVKDGSLRSRAGFDAINATTIKDLVAFDRMDRANTIALAGTLTSGHLWTAVATDDATTDCEVWNGTLRGANESGNKESASVLFESNGSTNPVSGSAHVAVEFDLRKYQGFGNTLRAFASDVDDITGRFSLVLRSSNSSGLKGAGSVDEDSYEIEFDVPVGLEGGADQTVAAPNHLRWNDLDIEVFKRTNSSSTRSTLGSAVSTTDGGPGVDEWMHVRIRIFGGSTTSIRVDVNGAEVLSEDDTGASGNHTAAGFIKIRFASDGAANNEKKLKRQIQIANFQVYTLTSAGVPNATALRIENLHRHTQANGDAHLLAHALTADGALIVQRPAGDGSTVSAVFYSMQPGFATDNSDVVVTGLKLNRRNGFVTAVQPTLDFTLGSDRFTITDTETIQKGFGQYTFAAGDRLHLIGAFAKTTVDASSSTTVLNVTSTVGFNVGQVIRIGPTNPTIEEIGTIVSIQDGVSLTLSATLQFTHTNSVVVAEELDSGQITLVFASTTVDADSDADQKVLNVTATANFKVGGSVAINPNGSREEVGLIESIQAGASLTLVDNLVNAHTAAQADSVVAEELDAVPLGILPGFFEVLAAPVSNVLTVLGVPAVLKSLTSVGVVYRIVSKHQGDGIAGVMNNNTHAADFADANAMTYIADGSDRVHRANGEAFYPAGIQKPTVKPILGNTGTGSGIMKGDRYSYRLSFWNPFLGLESSASPASTEQAIADEAFVTLHGSQNDNQFSNNATHLRLYRLNSTDSQTKYYRSRELPIPIDNESGIIIVEDRTADTDLTGNATIPEQLLARSDGTQFSDFAVHNPPPAAVLLAWRQDKMFYVTADSTRLWFSKSGVPDYVSPFNFVEVGRGDGESIRAVIPFREQLVILKDRSLWILVGETQGTFQVQRMSDRVGCSSHRAVAEADDGLLYFAGELGIHRWNGQFAEDLHYGIRDTYYGLNQDRLKHMALAIDPEDQRIALSVTRTGQTEQDRWLVLNYRRPGIQVEGGVIFDWTLWDLLATCFELDPMVSGASDLYRRKLRFGRTGGIVATFRGDDGTALTDNGTGITWFWEGPKLELGTGRDKRFKYLTIEFEKVSVPSTVSLGYKVDEEASATDVTFDQSVLTRKVQAVRRRGHYLRPRFSGSASTVQTRVLTYALNFDLIGRR